MAKNELHRTYGAQVRRDNWYADLTAKPQTVYSFANPYREFDCKRCGFHMAGNYPKIRRYCDACQRIKQRVRYARKRA